MEKKESKIEEVSAIKMSMSSLHYKGIDIKNTYKRCIEALLAYYYEFQDTKFLEVAYKYIEAFEICEYAKKDELIAFLKSKSKIFG